MSEQIRHYVIDGTDFGLDFGPFVFGEAHTAPFQSRDEDGTDVLCFSVAKPYSGDSRQPEPEPTPEPPAGPPKFTRGELAGWGLVFAAAAVGFWYLLPALAWLWRNRWIAELFIIVAVTSYSILYYNSVPEPGKGERSN